MFIEVDSRPSGRPAERMGLFLPWNCAVGSGGARSNYRGRVVLRCRDGLFILGGGRRITGFGDVMLMVGRFWSATDADDPARLFCRVDRRLVDHPPPCRASELSLALWDVPRARRCLCGPAWMPSRDIFPLVRDCRTQNFRTKTCLPEGRPTRAALTTVLFLIFPYIYSRIIFG